MQAISIDDQAEFFQPLPDDNIVADSHFGQ